MKKNMDACFRHAVLIFILLSLLHASGCFQERPEKKVSTYVEYMAGGQLLISALSDTRAGVPGYDFLRDATVKFSGFETVSGPEGEFLITRREGFPEGESVIEIISGSRKISVPVYVKNKTQDFIQLLVFDSTDSVLLRTSVEFGKESNKVGLLKSMIFLVNPAQGSESLKVAGASKPVSFRKSPSAFREAFALSVEEAGNVASSRVGREILYIPVPTFLSRIPAGFSSSLGSFVLKIIPDSLELEPGGTAIFTCKRVDSEGYEVSIRPDWSVNRPTLGSIGSNGFFQVNYTCPPNATIEVQASFLDAVARAVVRVTRPSETEYTFVAGNIFMDTVWNEEKKYLITGDIYVPPGVTLTIEPGTKILVYSQGDSEATGENYLRSEIIVEGTLIARGTAEKPVAIKSERAGGGREEWGGIRFKEKGTGLLENVRVTQAAVAVDIAGAAPEISGCILSRCGWGVWARMGARGSVHHTEIDGCGTGFVVQEGAYPRFHNNVILSCSDMGACLFRAFPSLENNIIALNGQAGVLIAYNSRPVLRNNVICSNGKQGVVIDGKSTAIISHNLIMNNRFQGLLLYPYSIMTLENNVIIKNSGGIFCYDPVNIEGGYNDVWKNLPVNYYSYSSATDRVRDISGNTYVLGEWTGEISLEPSFASPNYEAPHRGYWKINDDRFIGLDREGSRVPLGLIEPLNLGTQAVGL